MKSTSFSWKRYFEPKQNLARKAKEPRHPHSRKFVNGKEYETLQFKSIEFPIDVNEPIAE